MIERPYYLNQLLRAKDTDFIKIITGIRRSGKSTLLEMLKKHLLTQGVPENHVIHISYEQIPWFPLEKAETLYAYIKEHITEPAHRYYLLIDEAQELEEWAKVINGLKATFPLDIYITGSNSRLFSGEYLTYITGRYIEIKVYPLSLSEFMTFRGYDESNVAKAFNEYLTIGSFPAAAVAKDPELTEIINSGLFDSIFARDIIIRGGIRNEGVFLKAAKFIMENIGNPLSVSAISRTLKSQGSSASADTIDNYLTQMVNAYVLYQCERYDIRGKERLRTNGKYYVADLGLRNRLIGYRRGNLGHVIENLVYLELLRRGYTIPPAFTIRWRWTLSRRKAQISAITRCRSRSWKKPCLPANLRRSRKSQTIFPSTSLPWTPSISHRMASSTRISMTSCSGKISSDRCPQ